MIVATGTMVGVSELGKTLVAGSEGGRTGVAAIAATAVMVVKAGNDQTNVITSVTTPYTSVKVINADPFITARDIITSSNVSMIVYLSKKNVISFVMSTDSIQGITINSKSFHNPAIYS